MPATSTRTKKRKPLPPGSTTARGYGAEHQAERRKWVPLVEAGKVKCWRCGELIPPGSKWDLGHSDTDRSRYMGPEHAARCNRRAGGKKAGLLRRRPKPLYHYPARLEW